MRKLYIPAFAMAVAAFAIAGCGSGGAGSPGQDAGATPDAGAITDRGIEPSDASSGDAGGDCPHGCNLGERCEGGVCVPDDAGADGGADAGGPPDAGIDLDASGPTITPGAADRILLAGTVVTPEQAYEGMVLVEGDTITCVSPGERCADANGAVGATFIDTHGVIAPGLIDTHNHILFDIFDEADWSPEQPYKSHDEWPNDPRYKAMLDVKQCLANDSQGKPAWCASTPYGTPTGSLRCEMDKFGELKGLIAGTTSIVGLPGTSSACFSTIARSVDTQYNGLGQDRAQTSAIFPPSKESVDGVCANFASGDTTAYLVHCGEGIDAASLAEFQTLATLGTNAGCLLAPQTAITHGTAFGLPEFTTMAQHGMKLTWSPASNVFLYWKTADIPAAIAAGVTVSLAPDWSLGGSQNLLDEMRFADAWDNSQWGDQLTPKDIVLMTTRNAGKALALDDRLGRVEMGYLADLVVFSGIRADPYDAMLAATPGEVSLVMVGGVVMYGDKVLESAGPAQPGCESIDICGRQKFLCAATTETANKLNQTYADLKAVLEQALLDADAQTTGDGWSFAPLPPLVKCP